MQVMEEMAVTAAFVEEMVVMAEMVQMVERVVMEEVVEFAVATGEMVAEYEKRGFF